MRAIAKPTEWNYLRVTSVLMTINCTHTKHLGAQHTRAPERRDRWSGNRTTQLLPNCASRWRESQQYNSNCCCVKGALLILHFPTQFSQLALFSQTCLANDYTNERQLDSLLFSPLTATARPSPGSMLHAVVTWFPWWKLEQSTWAWQLPELWQVTRAAPGWSPGDTALYLRLCLGMTGLLHSYTYYNKHLCCKPLTLMSSITKENAETQHPTWEKPIKVYDTRRVYLRDKQHKAINWQ